MAYGKKYHTSFKDKNNSITYTLELHKKDFVGTSSYIQYLAPDPVKIQSRGSRSDKDSILQGSELTFNFFSLESDNNKYDEIFESQYRDWKILYYRSGVKHWEGWVKPENLSRQFTEKKYFISLSATDGLADLKDIQYPTTEGDKTILVVLKESLQQIGFELDFKIQLGTYESSLSTSTVCALAVTTVNTKRFINDDDGYIYNTNCYEVMQEALKPFNVTMKQEGGYYFISNATELNSYVYTFDFATLTQQSRIAKNLVVNLDSHRYFNQGQLSKIEPLQGINLIFQNRNFGENVLPTSYTNVDWDDYYISADGSQIWTEISSALSSDSWLYVESAGFNVTKQGDSDVIRVSFKHKYSNFTPYSIYEPRIALEYQKPSESTWTATRGDVTMFDNQYSNFEYDIPINATGTYKIRFGVIIASGTYSLDVDIIDIQGLTIYSEDDLTFDKLIKGTISGTSAIKTEERKIFFGDSFQSNDLGAFKIGSSITENWNRYGKTDNKPLHELYLLNLLNNNALYKNYLKIEIYDSGDTIRFNDVIQIRSKYYVFIGYSKSYKRNQIQAELIELLTTEQTVNYIYQSLTTVDGKSSSSTSASPSSGSGVGIDDSNIRLDATWSSNKINSELGDKAVANHDHSGVYEPAFSKNSAFNKNFGGTGSATTVSRSDHTHNYEPAFGKNTAFNKNFGSDAGQVAEGNHNHNTAYATLNHSHDSRYLRKDQADTTPYALTVGSLKLGSWEIKLNGTTLEFHYSGVKKMSLTTGGYLTTIDEQESYGS